MSTKKSRIGIAGCGRIAQVSHAPSLAEMDDVVIAAVMDPDRERAQALHDAHAPESKVFTDYRELLATDLDGVCICTPNFLHAPMAIEAFDHGLHVLCEKPMAGSLEDADRMLAAASAANRILHINQSLRYSPLYVTIADLISAGRIGDVQHVRCLRASGKLPNQSWSPGADWFVSSAHQGGLLLDIGIHMADVMRWNAGPVKRVSGLLKTRTPGIDVADNVHAVFEFANGASGVLELSWTFPAGGGYLEIYGTRGAIRHGFTTEPIELIEIDADGKRQVSHPEPAPAAGNSYTNFIGAIRGSETSRTPGELGREALAICLAIAESSESGRFTTISQPSI